MNPDNPDDHDALEVCMTPVRDVEVPDEVDDFYLKLWLIRDTGAVNMHNAQGVTDVADQLGFDDFVEWMKPEHGTRHERDYYALLRTKVDTVVKMENGRVNVGETSWVDGFTKYHNLKE